MERTNAWDLDYPAAWNQSTNKQTHINTLKSLNFRFIGRRKIKTNGPNASALRYKGKEWNGTYDEWRLDVCGFLRLRCFIGNDIANRTNTIWRTSWNFKRLRLVLDEIEAAWKEREILARRWPHTRSRMGEVVAVVNSHLPDLASLNELRKDAFDQGWVYFPGLRRITDNRDYDRWKLIIRLLTVLSIMPYGIGLLPIRIRPRRIPKRDVIKCKSIVARAEGYLSGGAEIIGGTNDLHEAARKFSRGLANPLREETLSRLTTDMTKIKRLDAYQEAYAEITGKSCSAATAKKYMSRASQKG